MPKNPTNRETYQASGVHKSRAMGLLLGSEAQGHGALAAHPVGNGLMSGREVKGKADMRSQTPEEGTGTRV